MLILSLAGEEWVADEAGTGFRLLDPLRCRHETVSAGPDAGVERGDPAARVCRRAALCLPHADPRRSPHHGRCPVPRDGRLLQALRLETAFRQAMQVRPVVRRQWHIPGSACCAEFSCTGQLRHPAPYPLAPVCRASRQHLAPPQAALTPRIFARALRRFCAGVPVRERGFSGV
jgi:hypothetical protein